MQTSSILAAGDEGGTVGRVCLLTMEAGGQTALGGGEGRREGSGAGGAEPLAGSQQPQSAGLPCRRC